MIAWYPGFLACGKRAPPLNGSGLPSTLKTPISSGEKLRRLVDFPDPDLPSTRIATPIYPTSPSPTSRSPLTAHGSDSPRAPATFSGSTRSVVPSHRGGSSTFSM